MISDPTVTIADVRAAKRCMAGSRQWVAAHGLDWNHFVTKGYPASVLDATGDGLITAVTDAARKRTNGQ